VLSGAKRERLRALFLGVCEMVHIRSAPALLVTPHRTFPLPDCLGKAVWIGLALLGFWASSTSSFHGHVPLLAEKKR
jgi:hypothetical protein